MTPPTNMVTIAFAVIAGVTGLSLYFDYNLPIWACVLIGLPIVAAGIWLDSYLWNKRFNKPRC